MHPAPCARCRHLHLILDADGYYASCGKRLRFVGEATHARARARSKKFKRAMRIHEDYLDSGETRDLTLISPVNLARRSEYDVVGVFFFFPCLRYLAPVLRNRGFSAGLLFDNPRGSRTSCTVARKYGLLARALTNADRRTTARRDINGNQHVKPVVGCEVQALRARSASNDRQRERERERE